MILEISKIYLCYYLTKTQIQFMTHTRYVWYVLLFTIFLPNLLHAQVRGEEKVVFDFDCKAELQEVSFKGTAGADYITIHHDSSRL